MGGFMFVMSPCAGCGQVFSYSAERVPSVRIDGRREPICQACVDEANPRRIANGLDPIVVLPGAYEGDPA